MRLILRLSRPAGWLLGAFIIANAAGELLCPGFAADHLWIRSAQLVPGWRVLAVALAAALFLPEGFLRGHPTLGAAAAALAAVFAGFAALDAGWFYAMLLRGEIHTRAVVPFSILIAGLLSACAWRIWRTGAAPAPPAGPPRRWPRSALADLALAGALGAAALLAFILTYGPTDYAKPADCAVVFGAKAHPDGRPSLALYDRTMEGVNLYRRGLVRKLLMSGAIDRGAGGVSEPQVMRRLALEAGVPDEDILLDESGEDSWATIIGARRLAAEHGWKRLLLVSHYYHLPRLRLAADRAGLSARTVPCRQTRRLAKEPYGIARECLALGYYYFFHLPQNHG
jgi:vancomycin permeability regulator SanA